MGLIPARYECDRCGNREDAVIGSYGEGIHLPDGWVYHWEHRENITLCPNCLPEEEE